MWISHDIHPIGTFNDLLTVYRGLWKGSLWKVLQLSMRSSGLCGDSCEEEVCGKSWDFYWYPVGYVEVSMKWNLKWSPGTSHETFLTTCGYPREEKYNGRIYDFTWDTLDCMEASLKRKLMENPGTVWRSLWREVLWDFPWDPLGCVMASVGNQWDILRLPNKILWTTPFFI